MNPRAQMRKPMTLEDHQSSRLVVDPLHLFDCCLVSNGAVAVIMTTAERATHLRQPPVYVGPPRRPRRETTSARGREPGHRDRREAGGRAGVRAWPASRATTSTSSSCTTATRTPCSSRSRTTASARRARAARSSRTASSAPAARCPTTRAAGSSRRYYMWGFTPLSEAVIQARGQAGERQVAKNDIVLGERQRRRPQLSLDDDPEQACRLTRRSSPLRPVPVPDEASAPFFEGAARGELMLQRCRACGAFMWPVKPRCVECFSGDVEWARGERPRRALQLRRRAPAISGLRGAVRRRHGGDARRRPLQHERRRRGSGRARDRDAARGRVRAGLGRCRRPEVQAGDMS